MPNYEYTGDGTVSIAFPMSGVKVVAKGVVVELDATEAAGRSDFAETSDEAAPLVETYPDAPAVGALDDGSVGTGVGDVAPVEGSDEVAPPAPGAVEPEQTDKTEHVDSDKE